MFLKNSKKSGQWSVLIILALLVVSGASWWSSNLHSTPVQAAGIIDKVKDPQPPAARPPQQAEDACYCSSDIYNCNNFQYQQEAQACYDDCQAQGRGDIHELDSNSNGLACEELPLEPTPITSQATPYTDPAFNDPVFRSLANADNLLTNGNFEADFYGAPELGFEPPETGWIPNSWGWFKSQAYGKYNIYGNEGFALVCPDDFRLFTNSALSLSFHIQSSDQPDARLGVYQTVSVTPGQQYLFAIQGAIQSQPGAGSPDINNRLEVFFDQSGGTDWQATPHEKWTSLPWREQELEFETSGPNDPDLARIQEYYTIVKPSSNRLTVFLNAWRRWPNWRTTIFTVDCVSLTPLNQVDVAALAPRLTQLSTTAVDAALKGSGGVAAPASVSGQPAAAPVTGAVIAPAAGGIVDTKSNWLLITAVSLLVILGLVGAGVWNARRQKE